MFQLDFDVKFPLLRLLLFLIDLKSTILLYHALDKRKYICIQTRFNNPTKDCFSDKKYTFSIQTRTTQIEISIFLICVQNQLPNTFSTALACIKILEARNTPPPHEFQTLNVLLHIKLETKFN